ncbi:hypothetical protein ABZ942_35135 [Nocardia sp. NPDC046473]|uniref:hypothetical protein n=1 Tax=Nocardia sp. NPDC046473 TaxID=3155733 RepID=UPI0033D0F604
MNKAQLQTASYGIRLLTGHLRQDGESLDMAIASRDFEAAVSMVSPLVSVSIILVRQLKSALGSDVSDALRSAHASAMPKDDACWAAAVHLIEEAVAGDAPSVVEQYPIGVGIGAQDIARGAASALAQLRGEHPNAVVAQLRKQLREQVEAVQLADKESVEAKMEEYASDPVMRASRIEAASALVVAINESAVALHDRAIDLNAREKTDARDSYEGVCRVAVTAAALGAGVIQLIEANNHYPAYALVRQIVETEFVLWKFQREPILAASWLNSDRDAREQSWKPSRIYRDGDNEYRQKDYAGHCEMGGHPTPTGTLVAAGERSSIAEASVLGDLILHLRESWIHILVAADALDLNVSESAPSVGGELRAKVENELNSWSRVDKYGFSTSYFSDPID